MNKTNDLNKRILLDLGENFDRKLRLVISDTASVCQAADIDNSDIVELVITSLVYELIRATTVLGMDEDDFIRMSEIAYRSMIGHIRRDHRQ